MTTYASAPESAKLLKATLRKAFPATAFTVRLSRGTGYGYCHVGWTDGPSTRLVQAVADRFEGEGFDGMVDCSYHKDNLLPDGRQTGLRGVNCSRHISAASARRPLQAIADFWGIQGPLPGVIEHRPGGHWSLSTDGRPRADLPECWTTY